MREFTTAAREATKKAQREDGVTFKVDGREVTAYKPEPGQWAMAMAGMGRHSTSQAKAAAVINFFFGILDDDSAAWLTDRLLDPGDDFELDNIQDILEGLIEEWTGNPTGSPVGSTPSPQTDGSTSTPPTPVLT